MRHRLIYCNAVDMALRRVQLISRADVEQMAGIIRKAIAGLLSGADDAMTHWTSLADTANLAETLEAAGLGSGDQAREVVSLAQEALAYMHQERQARGTWALRSDERALIADRLQALRALHETQLAASSYGEFEQAYHRTEQRLRQARAGNAPRGAIVIEGMVG